MEKKYIIKLEENEIAYKTVNSNGRPMIGLLHPSPYTEPDLEQVRKEAYEHGLNDSAKVQTIATDTAYKCGYEAAKHECEDCQKQAYIDAIRMEGYQKGLSDAWDAARKIIHMPEGDLLNIFTECYSAVCTALQVLLKYDASEAIEKIRQYEQEREEIQVGDEVCVGGDVGIAVNVRRTNSVYIVWADGSCGIHDRHGVTKTGRHFSEIAEVLQKMKEEE